MAEERAIDMSVEVAVSADAAWTAVATGPGIGSWYVPHTIEEREGGAASASFGPGMDVSGTVTGWDPPRWFRLEGNDDGPGLTFEWFVEPLTDTTSIVRLVNGGFGAGPEWDGQYDAMVNGWTLFLTNLQLHCEHFAGRAASASLPMAMWEEAPDKAWERASAAFGFESSPTLGDQLEISAPDAPRVVGRVTSVGPTRVIFTTTEPASGTGFITAEDQGISAVSLWLYLYGDDAEAKAEAHQSAWMVALEAAGPG